MTATSTDFRHLIAEKIRENRPSLTNNSLRTYVSILANLHDKHLKGSSFNLDYFSDNLVAILNYLKDVEPTTRKTVLSALFVLTNNPLYREKMIEDCKIVNDNYKNQNKSEKEVANWITTEEIKAKYDGLHTKVLKMFKKTAVADTSTIVEYLLIALLGGILPSLPPRRSLDMALLKIRNYNLLTDNYYKSGKLYFNKYKTSQKYGLQTLSVPEELNKIIKKWIKINDTDYLLFSTNGNQLSSPQITRILNKIFDGKNISVDMLRHIYLTNYYKDMPSLREMEAVAADMGHTIQTAMTYIKK